MADDYPYDDPKKPGGPEESDVAEGASGEGEPQAQGPATSPVAGPQADPYGLGSTRFGLAAHVIAGLSYFFWPVLPLIFYLMETQNRFVRFHALQSLILGLGAVGIGLVAFVLSFVPIFGWFAWLALWVGVLALVIWGIVSGFTGQWTRLPIVGEIAAQQLKLDG